MTGYEQAKAERNAIVTSAEEAREEIKETLDELGTPTKEAMHKAISSLSTIQDNSELAAMYAEAANMGSENLQGSLPMLKIHTANKSVNNLLANGKEPNDGWFFYGQTGEEFEKPVVHVLTVSKGFRSEGMVDSKTGEKGEDKFNQIMGGVIDDNGTMKPFIFYFTGMRLAKMWEFGKEASKYTHAKPVPMPMFALSVRLTTSKEKHKYGFTSVVNFEILKNENGSPVVIGDVKTFQALRNMVEQVEETITALINSKSTEETVQGSRVVREDAVVVDSSDEIFNSKDDGINF